MSPWYRSPLQRICRWLETRGALGLLAALGLLPGAAVGQDATSSGHRIPGALRIEKIGAPERAFHVVSTMIVGPTESILFDGQYKVGDGRRVADRVAATGTKLKAVIISHADHDHYMGAIEVIRRFPGTPVYMTPSALDDFSRRSQSDWAAERRRGNGADAPDELVVPELLPEDGLVVDGNEIRVIADLVGDVRAPASAALWIPSLRTVLAGDLVFEGIHPWLGDADRDSRKAWRRSLERLRALEPAAVVPGHKRDLTTPDDPAQIDFMIRYLDDYDAAMDAASTPAEVAEVMVEKYPDLAIPRLMAYGARTWFKK